MNIGNGELVGLTQTSYDSEKSWSHTRKTKTTGMGGVTVMLIQGVLKCNCDRGSTLVRHLILVVASAITQPLGVLNVHFLYIR